jgi:hypothetical protein
MEHEYLTALGLTNYPNDQSNGQGYDQHPKVQGEQHAEESSAHHASAHHLSHAAHHAASTDDEDEQQDENRSAQSSE